MKKEYHDGKLAAFQHVLSWLHLNDKELTKKDLEEYLLDAVDNEEIIIENENYDLDFDF